MEPYGPQVGETITDENGVEAVVTSIVQRPGRQRVKYVGKTHDGKPWHTYFPSRPLTQTGGSDIIDSSDEAIPPVATNMEVGTMETSVPVLPVVANASYGYAGERFVAGDCAAHVLNADVVKCGQDSILAKLDSQDAISGLRETLKSQCDLEHSIGDLKCEVIQSRVLAEVRECETRRHITAEAQATRDLINLDIRRRDDREIADLRLKLELCKCGCGCGSTGTGGPGNSAK